ESKNVDCEIPLFHRSTRPDDVEQIVLRNNLPGILHQNNEDLERLRRNLHRSRRLREQTSVHIKLETAELEHELSPQESSGTSIYVFSFLFEPSRKPLGFGALRTS